jgi:hypothetical protein
VSLSVYPKDQLSKGLADGKSKHIPLSAQFTSAFSRKPSHSRKKTQSFITHNLIIFLRRAGRSSDVRF